MRKQVILLAGLHKTATTSIQDTCLANREVLARAGYSYPRVDARDGPGSNHTFLLKQLFREQPDRIGLANQFSFGAEIAPRDQQRRRSELATALSAQPCPTILLVAEGVSTFAVGEMRNLKQWVVDQGFSLRVICNVRHLSSWIHSMVAQRVAGIVALTIPEALDELVAAGGIVRPRIEALKSAFPDAEFRSHERAVRHPQGPVAAFFDDIGFVDRPPMNLVRANDGRSDVATRAISLINQKFGRSSWTGPQDDLERHLRSTGMRGMRMLPGKKFTLRKAEAGPVLDLLQRENEWLRETLGQDFYDDSMEFRNEPLQWTPEALTTLNLRINQCLPEVQRWFAENGASLGLGSSSGRPRFP